MGPAVLGLSISGEGTTTGASAADDATGTTMYHTQSATIALIPVHFSSESIRPPYIRATKCKATEFMQYRSPVGGGSFGKTWPRWASQRAQETAIRRILWLLS